MALSRMSVVRNKSFVVEAVEQPIRSLNLKSTNSFNWFFSERLQAQLWLDLLTPGPRIICFHIGAESRRGLVLLCQKILTYSTFVVVLLRYALILQDA